MNSELRTSDDVVSVLAEDKLIIPRSLKRIDGEWWVRLDEVLEAAKENAKVMAAIQQNRDELERVLEQKGYF